jgi:hypothetical protein
VTVRRSGLSPAVVAGAALLAAVLSCGDVPTLPEGVAYITAVILPSPAVALNDTLRDSVGVVAPVRLYGIDNSGDTVRSLSPVFLVTTVPGKSVRLVAGDLVIGDSVRTAQIVGQVGSRLQTPPASLDVVRQPDSIAAASNSSTRFPVPTGSEVTSTVALGVTVTSPPSETNPPIPRAGVKSIIVRYSVTNVFPANATIPDTTLVLLDEAGRFQLPSGRASVDTTDAAGTASRRIRAIPLGFDSVEIRVSANNLRGVPLKGSPIRFVVTTK